MQFSVIIPVYNRPDEIVELLESLTIQSVKDDFEVIVIEDGSKEKCDEVIAPYYSQLDLHYFYQDNKGPGLARNFGASKAQGNYLLFFDSDCIVPSNYFEQVFDYIDIQPLDCFGGPDKAHAFFTPIQKAISYSMTSLITTGGIRGGEKKMDRFYPRSYNLGITRKHFDQLQGFSDMRFGEDLDFSMRACEAGLKVGLISDAFVYHKRRTKFKTFFKQVFNSGIARIDLSLRHKNTLKFVHFLPSLFAIGYPILFILALLVSPWFWLLILAFPTIIFIDAWRRMQSYQVAILSVYASTIQLVGYGTGFLKAFWVRVLRGKDTFHNFAQSFYD